MNIREFMKSEKMTTAVLAERSRISRGYLHALMNGQHVPSKRTCEDMRKATEGKVEIPAGLVCYTKLSDPIAVLMGQQLQSDLSER